MSAAETEALDPDRRMARQEDPSQESLSDTDRELAAQEAVRLVLAELLARNERRTTASDERDDPTFDPQH